MKKFNRVLLKVLSSKPTGVDENQKINMAAAIHLGKTDAMSYRHKDYSVREWKYHKSWKVLKHHKAFHPPRPQVPIDLESDDDDEEQEEEGEEEAAISDPNSFEMPPSGSGATASAS